MKQKNHTLSATELTNNAEKLARDYVNRQIEMGLTSQDMMIGVKAFTRQFEDFMIRDVRTFAATGKYPEYATTKDVDK